MCAEGIRPAARDHEALPRCADRCASGDLHKQRRRLRPIPAMSPASRPCVTVGVGTTSPSSRTRPALPSCSVRSIRIPAASMRPKTRASSAGYRCRRSSMGWSATPMLRSRGSSAEHRSVWRSAVRRHSAPNRLTHPVTLRPPGRQEPGCLQTGQLRGDVAAAHLAPRLQ